MKISKILFLLTGLMMVGQTSCTIGGDSRGPSFDTQQIVGFWLLEPPEDGEPADTFSGREVTSAFEVRDFKTDPKTGEVTPSSDTLKAYPSSVSDGEMRVTTEFVQSLSKQGFQPKDLAKLEYSIDQTKIKYHLDLDSKPQKLIVTAYFEDDSEPYATTYVRASKEEFEAGKSMMLAQFKARASQTEQMSALYVGKTFVATALKAEVYDAEKKSWQVNMEKNQSEISSQHPEDPERTRLEYARELKFLPDGKVLVNGSLNFEVTMVPEGKNVRLEFRSLDAEPTELYGFGQGVYLTARDDGFRLSDVSSDADPEEQSFRESYDFRRR